MSALAWFTNTKLGRWLVTALGIVGAILLVAWRAFSKGKKVAKQEQQAATLEALKDRKKSDADIDRLGDDDIRKRMQDHWSR
ncbi:hypothetical protein [Cohaesibacter gelatinilyticus]|uniref:Uncharacterized protein n=1 Tax=Cohaesibacter gelatinilyticus TaxID=372072 RepID=A0A285PM47_9HYPH|nr:hypothetical protein [Cohaesibacter gelatinilyticus]SNZ20961.1 hypothetical protein SAMN06265368_4075 [Cohaesibacter gelatinilyticus]